MAILSRITGQVVGRDDALGHDRLAGLEGSMLLSNWHYGALVVQVLPAALFAVLLLYINIRWGLVVRAKRLGTKG